jgi:hypothetical protein
MFAQRDGDIEVPWGATPFPGIALAAEAYLGAVVDPGGYLDCDVAGVALLACASALMTGIGDDPPLALAALAGDDVGKLAEDTSLQSPHLPGPATIGACSWLAARLVPDAMAQGAVLGAPDLHFLFTAESSLLKAYGDLTA